ncbi:MAG: response regulator [Dehalococcoidia bacterium]
MPDLDLDAMRVLVVEDEPAIRMVLTEVLSDEGYEVRGAGDGQTALGLLEEWVPRVILLDFTLPGMDGSEFRARQRALADAGRVPVILVTGAYLQDDAIAGFEADAIIAKPFDLDELVAVVARVIASNGS